MEETEKYGYFIFLGKKLSTYKEKYMKNKDNFFYGKKIIHD
jgi:hypothetical protein